MSAGKGWTEAEVKENLSGYTAVTIPLNLTIEGKQKIMSMRQVEGVLRSSRLIAITKCQCRTRVKGCDAPVDVCLSLDSEAEDKISTGDGKRVTLKEALRVLKRSHEAGLVHISYTTKGENKPIYICSCCSCCCYSFAAMQKFGFDEAVVSSDMISVQDEKLCNDCGECVEKCHFRARTMKGERMVYEKRKCSGCGLCVDSCPCDAISLERR